MSADESLRRQLRFAYFLQIAGATMFTAAAVIRVVSFGFDALAVVFAGIAVLIAGAAIFTRRKMRELAP
jgi:uncharacterized membrane protein YjjP (DUF1212 family)